MVKLGEFSLEDRAALAEREVRGGILEGLRHGMGRGRLADELLPPSWRAGWHPICFGSSQARPRFWHLGERNIRLSKHLGTDLIDRPNALSLAPDLRIHLPSLELLS